jgi:hypothetical protein
MRREREWTLEDYRKGKELRAKLVLIAIAFVIVAALGHCGLGT